VARLGVPARLGAVAAQPDVAERLAAAAAQLGAAERLVAAAALPDVVVPLGVAVQPDAAVPLPLRDEGLRGG
jgi:hypothetical protein